MDLLEGTKGERHRRFALHLRVVCLSPDSLLNLGESPFSSAFLPYDVKLRSEVACRDDLDHSSDPISWFCSTRAPGSTTIVSGTRSASILSTYLIC
ncbi:hypothetical protein FA13DRAFT_1741683 [Coprinellus micaceus]|uniref:Uncharacterized protein n=1 Tax=Coprinellus micaceus TaxID=71717 RepID=A0A4Y7SKG9_COPMI|nr:hypothetical protein FA13DRAFT_1741683 [Coprinellus micaceus]